MAVHLLNLLPTSTLSFQTPFEILYKTFPDYSHLRVFGCLCYPNLSSTTPHKLAPRSSSCIFLGFPANHRGFRCLDLSTNKIIISRHVIFDETVFPYCSFHPPPPDNCYSFLSPDDDSAPLTPSPFPMTSNTNLPPPPPPNPTSRPTTRHHMITRSQTGTIRPRTPLNLSVTSISPVPRSYTQALRDPNWKSAMNAELSALHSNHTWDLVPCPPNVNIVGSKWNFRIKCHSDGSLECYKAHLVAQGYTQQPGLDYDETFSPVVKPATIRTVLSLAISHSWPIHQLDVKNAFLHGHLSETVFMKQPPRFLDPNFPSHVCRLQNALYGLKQAPRARYQRFASYLTSFGFVGSQADPSLFILRQGSNLAYLLLYVDDIILTASSSTLLLHITRMLSSEFSMTDLGSLNYFLEISVTRSPNSLFLSQDKFASEILSRANL